MGSAVEWRERGWGAWSPSQGCPRCSVPALSPLSPTRGNHSPQAAPAGATAVCGHDRSPCHRMSPTHSCASVSLSASGTPGHLPPSWGQWWWLKYCFLGKGVHLQSGLSSATTPWCGLKVTPEGERKCRDEVGNWEARAQSGAHSWPVSTCTTHSLAHGSHTGPLTAHLPMSPLAAGTACVPSLGSLCAPALARLGSSVGVHAACACP